MSDHNNVGSKHVAIFNTFGLAILLRALAGVCCHASGLLDFFTEPELQVITATDMTPEGLKRPRSSPQQPIYYAMASVGYHEFGGILAGEKVPAKEEVVKLLGKILASQGFRPATDIHPATVMLLWMWGTMNPDRLPMGGAPNLPDPQVNRDQMLRFMGGDKDGLVHANPESFDTERIPPGSENSGADAQTLQGIASSELYFVAIRAYDFQDLSKRKQTLLWTTKISAPSRGFWLPEILPSMLTLAAPNIGRDTPKPVIVRADKKFKPDIRIGDPTVIEHWENDSPEPTKDSVERSAKSSGKP